MIRAARTVAVLGAGTLCVIASMLCVASLQAAGATRQASAATQGDAAQLAQQILNATGIQGGLIVHLGCGDGKLTAALRANERYVVHGLDADAAKLDAARRYLQLVQLSGPVSVEAWSGKRLPYIDNCVNLLVAEDLGGVPMEEVLRVLAPKGAAYVRSGGQWTKTVKPWPKDIDQWTHYLHDPSGNAVAHDSAIQPLCRMQWLDGPRHSRHHDHMSSISAMVSANGRNFYIFDEAPRASILLPPEWHLTARDAFNGTVLWKRPITTWHTHLWPFMTGPQSLTRRLVAVGDRVYVTLGADVAVSALDAATGETVRTYAETKGTEEILCDNGVLFLTVAADGQPLRSGPHSKVTSISDPLWTEAPRTLMAIAAESGKVLWKKPSTVVPMSLTADGRSVLFHDGQRIRCLDRDTGGLRWSSDPLAKQDMRSSGGVTIVMCDDVVLYSGLIQDGTKGHSTVTALSLADGKTLWKAEHPAGGHGGTPDDILVVGGLVWWGDVAEAAGSGLMTGRDLHNGQVKKEIPPDVQIDWYHHRCYRAKATDNYLLFARAGTEFIDINSSHLTPHHWVRGGCVYGVMPCNGLVYNPPHPCMCFVEATLNGFNALAPASKTCPPLGEVPDAGRLERGPAYASLPNPQSPILNPSDWATYRHDGSRSGATKAAVPADVAELWQTPLGGKLSSPTVAEGQVFVSSIETHTIHALNAQTGKPVWSYMVGGRVDSPPTVWQGMVLFGSNDGYVYCLRAADGQLAWRFRAAPEDRNMMAYEQVESVWPVPGSVLVKDGVAWCVAGRSMFLDGGLRLLRLDAATGRKLSEKIFDDREPASGKNLQVEVRGLNMPVALPDILSADDHYVYLRSLPLDNSGERTKVSYVGLKDPLPQPDDSHLFCPTGLLDDTLWHRTYWVYGRSFASGAGGYFQAGRVVPAGRLLVFDDDMVYGYGRLAQYYRWSTPYEYQLYSTKKHPEVLRMGEEKKPAAKANGKKQGGPTATPVTRTAWRWSDEAAIQVNSMVLAGSTLFAAGPPNLLDEVKAVKATDPETLKQIAEQEAAYKGQRGALLAAVSAADGKRLRVYRLDSMPTFDGLAAAQGKLYYSTSDGKIVCLGSGQGQPLPPAEDVPLKARSPEADQPAKPAPAARPQAAKAAAKTDAPAKPATASHPDFQYLEGVKVGPSKLGYRIQGIGQAPGVALKQLSKPISGEATLRMKMELTSEGQLLSGFLAFGDGTREDRLVCCGVRLKKKKAMILQGASSKDESAAVEFVAQPGRTVNMEVAVDLPHRKIKLTCDGATVDAPLRRPITSITHVGYCVISAATDFGPIDIVGH